ncbi:hypothetical protein, partial [Acetobacter senegalensis]
LATAGRQLEELAQLGQQMEEDGVARPFIAEKLEVQIRPLRETTCTKVKVATCLCVTQNIGNG